ncbi:hypothetical protein Drorol1_Dr00021401 [Drosera rotundifolia]
MKNPPQLIHYPDLLCSLLRPCSLSSLFIFSHLVLIFLQFKHSFTGEENRSIFFLGFEHIGNLTGISAQDLFLWFFVRVIRVDMPSSGLVNFDGCVVHKQFSLSWFEILLDCVAAERPQVDFDDILLAELLTWMQNQFDQEEPSCSFFFFFFLFCVCVCNLDK